MRRVRLTPGTTQPRGLNMSITMPASVPAAAAAPSGDCPCGPIGLVIFKKDSQEPGTSITLDISNGDYLQVIVAGKMPDASYAEFVDVVWTPDTTEDAPTVFMPDVGYIIGIPLYVGSIDAAGVGQGPGVLKFKVRATCGTGEELTTPEYTVTVTA